MPLNIKDRRAHELARQLAAVTGESITEAVRIAIEDRLKRIEKARRGRPLADRLNEIADHCAALPVRRSRTPDEILGYDERGLPR